MSLEDSVRIMSENSTSEDSLKIIFIKRVETKLLHKIFILLCYSKPSSLISLYIS